MLEHEIDEGGWECKNCGLNGFANTLPTDCPGKAPNHFSFINEAIYYGWIDYRDGKWDTRQSDEYLKLALLDFFKETISELNSSKELL